MHSNDALELIKKYSLFKENSLNRYADSTCQYCKLLHISFQFEKNKKHQFYIKLNDVTVEVYKTSGFLTEDKFIIACIVSTLNKLIKISWLDIDCIDSILKGVQIKSIVKYLLKAKEKKTINFLCRHIKEMEHWASQTYENMNICFSIGVDFALEAQGQKLTDLYQDDMLKVLTSGVHTFLICDKEGNIHNLVSCSEAVFDNNDKEKTESPLESLFAFQWIQNWSQEKIAITLTSHGDILIFSDGELKFVQRRSKWYRVKLTELIHWMPDTQHYDEKMKKAIAETCLDVSFRRTGACIGIIRKDEYIKYLVEQEDIIATSTKPRIQFLKKIIGDKKFQEIPREIRQELAAVDGAIVLGKDGTILSIGAILKIGHLPQRNRTTGGRSVAAQQLACYGFGIKVSADGCISAWRNKTEFENACPRKDKEQNEISCDTFCEHEKFFELF